MPKRPLQEAVSDEREKAIRKSLEYWWLPHSTLVLVSCIAGVWGLLVLREVPEPYLDEVFHIRQAQAYCASKFDVWDPKITTPPGLYLLSLPFVWIGLGDCSVQGLRSENLVLLGAISFVSFRFLARRSWKRAGKGAIPLADLLNDAHAAVNVALFPPLFFFSALYYTDVASSLFVLLFVDDLLATPGTSSRFSIRRLLYAALALSVRQTNVFWVAVFPLAIEVISALKTKARNPRAISDPTIESASLSDFFTTASSLVQAALNNMSTALLTIPQPVFVLVAFAGFVVWNGGVVLGDKSNHVATIHLPQMLYIWPYIAFFSAPILLPYNLDLLRLALSTEAQSERLPRLWHLLVFSTIAAVIVRFNTIVHPFTLADNRHYVFYVFRILLRSSLTKYGAIPVYILTGWLCIRRFGARPGAITTSSESTKAPTSTKEAKKNETPASEDVVTVSTAITWLATSALSLITAPLVEPRYFIIPWLIWRLLLAPTYRAPTGAKPTVNRVTGKENGPFATALKHHDGWLWLETLWFLAVNAVVGWVFLYRGFEWAQEPAKVQRFMW